jgi:hypothetical protein
LGFLSLQAEFGQNVGAVFSKENDIEFVEVVFVTSPLAWLKPGLIMG